MLFRFNLGPAQRDTQERGREQKCHSRVFQQPWSLCILWIMKRTFLSSWYISHDLCAHRQNLNATSLPRGVLYWTEPFYFRKIKTSGEKQIAFSFSSLSPAIVVHEMKLGQLLALIVRFSDFSISADAAHGHSWDLLGNLSSRFRRGGALPIPALGALILLWWVWNHSRWALAVAERILI